MKGVGAIVKTIAFATGIHLLMNTGDRSFPPNGAFIHSATAVIVSAIEPVINVAHGIIERFPRRHLVGQFILLANVFPFTMICAILDAETRVPIDI